MSQPEKIKKNVLLFALMGFILLAGCSREEPEEKNKEEAESFSRVYVVKEGDIPSGSSVTGTVRAIERVTLSSRINGYIISLKHREGDRITKGETLVEIDASTLLAELNNAQGALAAATGSMKEVRSALKNSRREYQRAKKLYKERTVSKSFLDDKQMAYEASQARLDQVRAKIRQAKAKVELMQVNLGFTVLKAPFDGVVIQRQQEEGDLAGVGTALMTLENDKNLEVIAEVKESELLNLAPLLHQDGAIKVEIESLHLFLEGTLTHIIPHGDPLSHTFRVKVRLVEAKNGVLSGMFARLFIPGSPKKGILIPADMVLHRGELTGVLVHKEGKTVFRVIRTGSLYKEGTMVEVLSGLQEGEQIVSYASPLSPSL